MSAEAFKFNGTKASTVAAVWLLLLSSALPNAALFAGDCEAAVAAFLFSIPVLRWPNVACAHKSASASAPALEAPGVQSARKIVLCQ